MLLAEDVIFMELGEGGREGKGFKISGIGDALLEEGQFGATRDPRSYDSIEKYFDEYAVPLGSRRGRALGRGYGEGESIFIGSAGKNEWGNGGGTQIFTPDKPIEAWTELK